MSSDCERAVNNALVHVHTFSDFVSSGYVLTRTPLRTTPSGTNHVNVSGVLFLLCISSVSLPRTVLESSSDDANACFAIVREEMYGWISKVQ